MNYGNGGANGLQIPPMVITNLSEKGLQGTLRKEAESNSRDETKVVLQINISNYHQHQRFLERKTKYPLQTNLQPSYSETNQFAIYKID